MSSNHIFGLEETMHMGAALCYALSKCMEALALKSKPAPIAGVAFSGESRML
jgi:hypothetical protein